MRNGEARRLSTGKPKKPWISFWCRSMVMMWVRPVRQQVANRGEIHTIVVKVLMRLAAWWWCSVTLHLHWWQQAAQHLNSKNTCKATGMSLTTCCPTLQEYVVRKLLQTWLELYKRHQVCIKSIKLYKRYKIASPLFFPERLAYRPSQESWIFCSHSCDLMLKQFGKKNVKAFLKCFFTDVYRETWTDVTTCFGQHGCQQFAHDGAPLPHLALLAVGEVGDDPDDVLSARGLQSVRHDQQLHDGSVHISSWRRTEGNKEYGRVHWGNALSVGKDLFIIYTSNVFAFPNFSPDRKM